jgi:hypothetical protein
VSGSRSVAQQPSSMPSLDRRRRLSGQSCQHRTLVNAVQRFPAAATKPVLVPAIQPVAPKLSAAANTWHNALEKQQQQQQPADTNSETVLRLLLLLLLLLDCR